MRKIILFLIILLSLVLLSSIVSAQLMKFIPLDIISNFFNNILRILGITSTVTSQKTIPSSGTIVYSDGSLTIGRMWYADWRISAETRTAKSDLWIGHWDALDQAEAAKRIRSDFKAFLYCNIMLRYRYGTNDPPGTFDKFMNNGWLLKDANEKYVTEPGTNPWGYWVDIGNPEVQQWYANWLNDYVKSYNLDGVQLDNTVVDTEFFYFATTYNVINPRTGSVWTDDDVVNAMINFANTVKQTLGPDKIVLGNGVWNGNHFYRPGKHERILRLISESQIDGIISEGWMSDYKMTDWYSEDLWLKSINMTVWLQDNLLAKRQQGVFMPIAASAGPPDWSGAPGSALPPGVSREQYVTYVFASLLLAAKSKGNYLYLGDYIIEDYPQSLFKIDLGVPSSAYKVIVGPGPVNVYTREFSKGKVLVNPTYSATTINLGGSYKKLDGTTVSSITMSAHTGEILLKS